jgi:PAS domain S-box-containing protein
VLPDGQTRWIATRGSVRIGAGGKARLMHGVAYDVTGRKQVEVALRESEIRFRTVADTAPVMIWMSGKDKLCTFFNKGWLDFTGRTHDEELGNGWAEGVHSEDFDRCLEIYANAFDARQRFALEYRLRRRDGKYRRMLDNGVPRFAPDGTFLGYIGCCLDITESKNAEERFRLAVEAAPNAMIMVNADGRITLANAQVEAVFGYPRQELMGLPIETLIPERLRARHSGDPNYFVDPSPRAMGAGPELFGLRKDGSEVPVEIGINPIETSEGPMVLASIVDVTARKRAQLEIEQQRNELAHLARVTMLGELSGSLAHELNQPLTAILSNAQAAQRFLARDDVNLDEVRAILQDIVADDKRAGEVIRGLRLLLKKGEMQSQSLDLNDAVRDVLRLMRSDMLNAGIIVNAELAPGLPMINGDRVQLQQVLLNLVVNAGEAMAGVAATERRLIVRTALAEGEGIRVSIADQGHGIAPENLERVFEPFFTTKAQGLGLGLAVCRSIIIAHGGRLWATRNSRRGASFHFTLAVSS